MTTRILPPDEWPRLIGTELETVWPHLPQDRCQVIVVERDGEIVACWMVMTMLHLEGVWIAPAYRKSGSVARRLIAKMRELVGCQVAVTSALTPEVRTLIEKLGGTLLPGEHFALPAKGL